MMCCTVLRRARGYSKNATELSAVKANFIMQFLTNDSFYCDFMKNYDNHYYFTFSYNSISKNRVYWRK